MAADPIVAGVRISSPERAVFPDAGLTKLELAQHYARAGERMAEIAGHRPLSLVRCPEGLTGECFYQKHASRGFPEQLREIDIKESGGKIATYLYVTHSDGFVAAAQMGTIEFHVWGARTDALEKPDRLVFDLDPDEGLDFGDVKTSALEVREKLAGYGLASTAMVTGGKGVHVIVPLRRTISWDTLKIFAKSFAQIMTDDAPDRYTATMSKAKRKGRIFIDWLRNERGSTAIAPYAARARKGAPVAMPVTWAELRSLDAANGFSFADAEKRLDKPCPYLKALNDLQTISSRTVKKMAS